MENLLLIDVHIVSSVSAQEMICPSSTRLGTLSAWLDSVWLSSVHFSSNSLLINGVVCFGLFASMTGVCTHFRFNNVAKLKGIASINFIM